MDTLKRFFLFLVLAVSAGAQSWQLPQPQQYAWFGDTNWTLLGPSWYNNEPGGALGTPYTLLPDVTKSGTINYQFTAGIGGGLQTDDKTGAARILRGQDRAVDRRGRGHSIPLP